MKKIFTTLLIIIGLQTVVFSQSRISPEFGINVGYNVSYVVESGTSFNSAGVGGFNIGVSGDFPFSDRWSVKVRAIYDQKGYSGGYIVDAQGNEADGVDFKFNYITVPVMANWHFGRKRNWYLNFGPYVGFLTSAKESTDNVDVKSQINSTDFGLALGIGVKIPISDKAKFFIEYDGQGGFLNVLKDGNGDSLQNARTSLNVGVSFSMP